MEPESTIPDLVSHTDFLRRLARRLIRDEHAAEDIVQDALVAAIEKPPPFSGAPRAWFTAVVRNLGRMHARERRRRERREAAVARADRTSSTADAAASLEIARRVVAEVTALDEPYRTVLVLRYYHDLRFTEIAARLGCPVATVRTRHHRALARLRDRLDERSRGNRRAWVMALLPLIEGVVMKKTIAAVLALLLLLLFFGFQWLLIRGEESPGPTEPSSESIVAAADLPTPAAGDPEDASGPGAEAMGAEGHPPDDVAVVSVVDGDGRVVAGARVSLIEGPFDLDIYVPTRVVAEAVTDARGRARFDVEPFTRYSVKVVHPEYAVTGDVTCWGGNMTELPIRRAGALAGVVRDIETGFPIEGATVWVMDWCMAGVLHEWVTTTDRGGRYRVDGLGSGKLNVCAWAPGYADAFSICPFTITPGVDYPLDHDLTPERPIVFKFLDADTGLPVPEVTFRYAAHPPITGPGTGFPTYPMLPEWPPNFVIKADGYPDRLVVVSTEELATPGKAVVVRIAKGLPVIGQVRRKSGEPAKGVRLRLRSDAAERTQWIYGDVETDGEGRFRSRVAVPGGRVRWEVLLAGGSIQQGDWREVPDLVGEVRLDPIVLAETTVLAGRVLYPDGTPVYGGIVSLPAPPIEFATSSAKAYLDPRGRFRLCGVPLGPVDLHLTGVDGYPSLTQPVQAGRETDLVWRLAGGQEITGRVLDAADRPCPGEWVKAEPGGAMSRTDESGRFQFLGLKAGTYRVSFMYNRDSPALEVRGNTYDVVLRLPGQ